MAFFKSAFEVKLISLLSAQAPIATSEHAMISLSDSTKAPHACLKTE
jgi:hypothetical protein